MVYLPGIPNATDIPSNSQPQIRENFTQIDTQFSSEHVALNAGAANGQHLAISLPRNPAVVAPVGTTWQLHHKFSAVKDSLDIVTSAGVPYFNIPLRHAFTGIVLPAATVNIVLQDMATASLGGNSSGTIHLHDSTSPGRSIFTTFVWVGGTCYLPGNSGQLVSSTSWLRLAMNGTILRLITDGTNPAGAGVLIITESRNT